MTSRTQDKSKSLESTRTTLTLGNDVLILIRQRAEVAGQSMGEAATDLIRESVSSKSVGERRIVNGILLLPKRNEPRMVTMELVNELRDEMQ